MRPYRFSRPPRALRRFKMHKVHLDNVALVPASLLPYKRQWQVIANKLASGSVLICMPPTQKPQCLILEKVALFLRNEGHQVTILPADRFV
jgi:hypothetical protein